MTLNDFQTFDAYLFDIDGTLLNCRDAVHYFAFCDALTRTAGRPLNLDGVQTHGNTDPGILRDAFTLAAVPESQWRPKLPEIFAGMAHFVAAHTADLRIDVLPAVPELLHQLRNRQKTLAVATGNLRLIGETKLRHTALLDSFHLGAYSDRHVERAEIFAAAIAQARAQLGRKARIVVLGDTPADITAARANALPIVSVSTGTHSFETLASLHPDLCLETLTPLLN